MQQMIDSFPCSASACRGNQQNKKATFTFYYSLTTIQYHSSKQITLLVRAYLSQEVCNFS